MDAVQRRGSCARMNYIKRVLAWLLVVLLCFCWAVPTAPRAEAVTGVDDAVIAAFILVASAMGLSFVADSSQALANYISNYLAGFTSSGGFSVVDIVVSWVTGGSLRLSQDEALFMTEAVLDMIASNPSSAYFLNNLGQSLYITDFPASAVDGEYVMPLAYGTVYRWSDIPAEGLVVNLTSTVAFRLTKGSTSSIYYIYYYSDGSSSQKFALQNISNLQNEYIGWAVVEVYSNYLALLPVAANGTVFYRYGYDRRSLGVQVSAVTPVDVTFAGDVSSELADLANQMDAATEAVIIPTVLSPADTITGAQAGTLAVPQVTVGEIAVTQPGTAIGDLTLTAEGIDSLGALMTTKFPFSIPWDFARAIGLLAAPAEAPYWEVDIMAPIEHRVGSWAGDTTIELDFEPFEGLAAFVRWIETIVFCAGLAMATKRLIWTA